MAHREHKKDDCQKKCKRYSSWSESSSDCEKPKCHKKCYKVCTIKCEQKRRDRKEWGHKVKCVDSWTSISGSDKLEKKKCEKKHEKKSEKKCERARPCHRH